MAPVLRAEALRTCSRRLRPHEVAPKMMGRTSEPLRHGKDREKLAWSLAFGDLKPAEHRPIKTVYALEFTLFKYPAVPLPSIVCHVGFDGVRRFFSNCSFNAVTMSSFQLDIPLYWPAAISSLSSPSTTQLRRPQLFVPRFLALPRSDSAKNFPTEVAHLKMLALSFLRWALASASC